MVKGQIFKNAPIVGAEISQIIKMILNDILSINSKSCGVTGQRSNICKKVH